MNILITGCNGQLGNEMQILSRLHPRHKYLFTDISELDICNQEAIEETVSSNQIDCIVNCAAYTAVDKAEKNEVLCDKLNHLAPSYLAASIEKRHGNIIQISTDYVFDGTAHTPYKEDALTCPHSVYGKTKLAGETAVMKNCQNTVILRTAWLYSPFGNNFVKTMLRLGHEKQELGVIFDQIGTPTYAHDLAAAIFAVIEQGIKRGIYHFSNEGVISWYDFTKAIHRIAGITTCNVKPLHTEDYPAPAYRPHYSVLDKTKFKETFNFEIPYWEDSLRDCIKILENKKNYE